MMNWNLNVIPKREKQKDEKPKLNLLFRLSCGQNTWVEFVTSYYYQNCEIIITEQKHQIAKNIHRQDKNFSTRLPSAFRKIREIYFSLMNIKF